MSFFDDIQAQLTKSGKDAIAAVGGVAAAAVESKIEPLIKVGKPANGNLSAQDVKDGKTGSTDPLRPSSQDPSLLNRAMGASDITVGGVAIGLPVLALAALCAYLYFKKRR